MILQKKNAIHFDDLVEDILLKIFQFNSCLHCSISTWGSVVCFSSNIFEQSKENKNKNHKEKNSLNKVYLSMFRNNNNSRWISLLLIIAISSLHFCILILWYVRKYLGLKIIHFLALLISVIVFQFGYLLFVLLVSLVITFFF